MKDILSMNIEELQEYVEKQGEKSYRAKQVFEWLHKSCAVSWDEMTNLPAAFRERMSGENMLPLLSKVDCLISKLDGTSKFLFRLSDGNVIESVLMKYEHGYSVCISSQVGCRMGCRFCASAIGGRVRDLSAGEMLAQIYAIQREREVKVSNVVIMGTGEPLDNFDNLLTFIRLITSEEGQHLSARNITVSTCGLVPEIKRLADEKLAITLALSLHAPNDRIRRQLMPVAMQYDLKSVMEACGYYFRTTGRRMTFEYSLIDGVNDSDECAVELSGLLRNENCHVNLIPVNSVKERAFRRGSNARIQKFKNILEKSRINVTIRREMGADIDGACGQLRRSYENEMAQRG